MSKNKTTDSPDGDDISRLFARFGTASSADGYHDFDPPELPPEPEPVAAPAPPAAVPEPPPGRPLPSAAPPLPPVPPESWSAQVRQVPPAPVAAAPEAAPVGPGESATPLQLLFRRLLTSGAVAPQGNDALRRLLSR